MRTLTIALCTLALCCAPIPPVVNVTPQTRAATITVQTKPEYVALERAALALMRSGQRGGFFVGTVTVPDLSGECVVTTTTLTEAQQVTVLANFNDPGALKPLAELLCGGPIVVSQYKAWGKAARGLRIAAVPCQAGSRHAFIGVIGAKDEGVDP